MCEPHKPGDHWTKLKYCRCMNSCGSVEDKFYIYKKNTINGLHLISELYDPTLIHDHKRIYLLTERTWENRRHEFLVPQTPYIKKKTKTWAQIVSM